MEADGKLTAIFFEDRDKLLDAADPVKKTYAEELGAAAVLEAINAIE